MARVLRFWLTPARNRVCSCGLDTGDLAKHLLFHCSKTHPATAAYASSLEPQIISHFTPNKLIDFLRKVVRSEKLLENFNLLVGTFEYPRYWHDTLTPTQYPRKTLYHANLQNRTSRALHLHDAPSLTTQLGLRNPYCQQQRGFPDFISIYHKPESHDYTPINYLLFFVSSELS